MRSDTPPIVGWFVPIVALAAGAMGLFAWLTASPTLRLAERAPGADISPGQIASRPASMLREGRLTKSHGVPADIEGAWQGFRGGDRDNINKEDVYLLARWPAGGPKRLWSIDVGEGYAGAAVLAGRVYVHDYDRRRQADAIRCLSLADGSEIWRYSYPVRVKRNHGMSRTVPAVTGDHLVALGPKCHVTCLDAKSGQLRWRIDLVKDYGTKVPPWYAGQCPLIDRGAAIIAPGGTDVLMMAVDCATGRIKWKTPNDLGWAMTHSSVMLMKFAGVRTYVYCAARGVVGVSADDGRLLWHTDKWRIKIANIPSPVPVGKGRIFLSGGYNAGSMMLQLSRAGGKISARPLFRLDAKVFGATQQTPILYEGYLYGIRPNGELVCLDLSGGVIWSSGRENRFGRGPFLIAQGLIYAMDENGMLTLARAAPSGYEQLCRALVLPGNVSEGPMALAGGRLIVRDLTTMVCLDVAER